MKQENFLYNEQQKKQELYERDADFAHIIASRLNQLIEDKVLTGEDVGRASHDKLDEFLYLFHDQIIDGFFYSIAKGKIKRFFNGESTETVDLKKRVPIGEQYTAMMKEVLMYSKEQFFGINGMVLFGSRMGSYADSESDCDFVWIGQNRGVSPANSSKIAKKYGFPDGLSLSAKLDSQGRITVEDLKCVLKNPADFSWCLWTWSPNRVRYIGDDEENINQQIQQALNSDAFKQYKKEMLDSIKKFVKQQAQI